MISKNLRINSTCLVLAIYLYADTNLSGNHKSYSQNTQMDSDF